MSKPSEASNRKGGLVSLRRMARLRPAALWAQALYGLAEAGAPFVNVIFPAFLVNQLTSGAPARVVWLTALLTVLLNALAFGAKAALGRWREYETEAAARAWRSMRGKKFLNMDFSALEDGEVESLRQSIYQNEDNFGGIYGICGGFKDVVKNLAAVAGALATLVVMLASTPSSGQGFIHGPGSMALVMGFCLLSAALVFMLQMRNGKLMPGLMERVARFNQRGMYLISSVLDNYPSGKDIRIYGAAPLVSEELNAMNQNFKPVFRDMLRINLTPAAAGAITSALMGGLIFSIVGLKALGGGLDPGSVVWFAGSVQQFSAGIAALVFALGDLNIALNQSVFTERLMALPDTLDSGQAPLPEPRAGGYELEIKNLSFRYPGSQEWVLRGVNLNIQAGEHLAVVGLNGSGKTTLIKLICRLYKPTEGSILLNGTDIQTLDRAAYLKLFSVVFQDFKLFSFGLGENVAANPDYDADRVKRALQRADASGRLERMPLEQPLYRDYAEDGVEISGGEAQKAAIARAIYRDAPFVVLDEPTAALDPLAEQEVYARFGDMMRDKTALFISHRLSSCRFCRDIAVFDQGSLIQRGSHEALLQEEGGRYAQMWNAQAQYYQ